MACIRKSRIMNFLKSSLKWFEGLSFCRRDLYVGGIAIVGGLLFLNFQESGGVFSLLIIIVSALLNLDFWGYWLKRCSGRAIFFNLHSVWNSLRLPLSLGWASQMVKLISGIPHVSSIFWGLIQIVTSENSEIHRTPPFLTGSDPNQLNSRPPRAVNISLLFLKPHLIQSNLQISIHRIYRF